MLKPPLFISCTEVQDCKCVLRWSWCNRSVLLRPRRRRGREGSSRGASPCRGYINYRRSPDALRNESFPWRGTVCLQRVSSDSHSLKWRDGASGPPYISCPDLLAGNFIPTSLGFPRVFVCQNTDKRRGHHCLVVGRAE
jgi:hypothetical protein